MWDQVAKSEYIIATLRLLFSTIGRKGYGPPPDIQQLSLKSWSWCDSAGAGQDRKDIGGQIGGLLCHIQHLVKETNLRCAVQR